MKTAVEWLVEEIVEKYNFRFETYYGQEIQQAKEMEKQQIVDAVNLPIKDRWYDATKYSNSGEQYYQKTYDTTIRI